MGELAEKCPVCRGKGCAECNNLGFIPGLSKATRERIYALFIEKMRNAYGNDHPFVRQYDARQRAE